MTDITGLDISKEHYCKGEELPVFTVTGGLEGKRYTLTFENLEINAEPIETVVKQQSHKFEFDAYFFTSLPAGYYRITVNQGSPWTDYIAVHANQTTWLGYSDNWNDWSNWSNGVPWGCTDVIQLSEPHNHSVHVRKEGIRLGKPLELCDNLIRSIFGVLIVKPVDNSVQFLNVSAYSLDDRPDYINTFIVTANDFRLSLIPFKRKNFIAGSNLPYHPAVNYKIDYTARSLFDR